VIFRALLKHIEYVEYTGPLSLSVLISLAASSACRCE
jgi:hypothetical protein